MLLYRVGRLCTEDRERCGPRRGGGAGAEPLRAASVVPSATHRLARMALPRTPPLAAGA